MIEVLTCADMERIGLWQTRRCCPGCHADIGRGDAHIDLEPDYNRHGRASDVRLVVCCNFYPARDAALDRSLFARALTARRFVQRAYRALTRRPSANDDVTITCIAPVEIAAAHPAAF
jgi:hypothetical protein